MLIFKNRIQGLKGMLRTILLLVITFCSQWLFSTTTDLCSIDKSVVVKTKEKNLDFSELQICVGGLECTVETGITINEKLYKFNPAYIQNVSETEGIRYYTINTADPTILLEIALFKNSFAFRYKSTIKRAFHVNSEESSFRVLTKADVYYFERKNTYKLKSYAGTWEHCALEDMAFITKKSPIQGSPLIFKFKDGKYGVITEVNLQNYSGARWLLTDSTKFKVNFTEGNAGFSIDSSFCTPWRVFFVSDNLTNLVNQDVIQQLSTKPNLTLYGNTDYIIPGKCVWRWFSKGTGTPIEEKQFIDYAQKLNFRYSMIDEGWRSWNNTWSEIKKLTTYANQKKVGIFLWQRSSEIADPANDYLTMRNWLDSIKNAGVKGIKVDFMDSESKTWIDFDTKLLSECAKRQVLVDFHGCQKPTGEQFTYPNEITREAIRGLELNKHTEGPIPSYHNALLPFTRLVLGHGDYTPLSFTNPGNTTLAHQLATFVAFDSRLQVMAEDPELILKNDKVNSCIDFIRAVPVIWDETVVLPQTDFGKTAVVARRSGKQWFIYALNGTDKTVELNIDLSKLIMQHNAKTIIFADDVKAKKILITESNQKKSPLVQLPVVPFYKTKKKFSNTETVVMAPNGGAVLWIR